MELILPIFFQIFYTTLKQLILAINVFIVIQRYIIVKKQTKESKKDVLQKTIIIYNRSKVHVDERRFANDSTLYKCNSPFNIVVLTKNSVWVLEVRKAGYNNKPILSYAHPTYKNTAITQDV